MEKTNFVHKMSGAVGIFTRKQWWIHISSTCPFAFCFLTYAFYKSVLFGTHCSNIQRS